MEINGTALASSVLLFKRSRSGTLQVHIAIACMGIHFIGIPLPTSMWIMIPELLLPCEYLTWMGHKGGKTRKILWLSEGEHFFVRRTSEMVVLILIFL